jgi:hypothetical protein
MLLIVALTLAGLCAGQTASVAIVNATLYTADPARPLARAIAIAGGKILAVGGDVSGHVGPATKVIDARGSALVPGFIDSHGHMRGLGDALSNIEFRNARTLEDALALVAGAARTAKPGDWITGRGWDQTLWPGARFPNADQLSKAAPENPVFLKRVDGHAAWVNRLALDRADINNATRDPEGGRIHRDSNGRPTGILIDRAQGLVSGRIPADGPDQVRERIARAAAECARLGLTSVHDAGVGAEEIAAYRELIAAGNLPVRIYAMIGGAGALWQEWLKRGPEVGPYLTIRSIKMMADGALGSRGAALQQDYSDEPGNRGLLIHDQAVIEEVARAAFKAGFQVNTHAIGDRGNRVALDAYAAVLPPGNKARFRVEHAQVVSPEDFALFRKYGVIASMQATHATSDMRWAEQRLGAARVAGAYAWRTFLNHGVLVANGSDFPVELPDPLKGFYASITRRDETGHPTGGWMPVQKLTRQEALESWTRAGAYAAFEEEQKGTLAPGKLADMVLLSRDIMRAAPAEILTARVKMTVMGGKVVYSE